MYPFLFYDNINLYYSHSYLSSLYMYATCSILGFSYSILKQIQISGQYLRRSINICDRFQDILGIRKHIKTSLNIGVGTLPNIGFNLLA